MFFFDGESPTLKLIFSIVPELVKQGYKTDNKLSENCIDLLLAYSRAYYDVVSATEV